jgi:hypothetical protein
VRPGNDPTDRFNMTKGQSTLMCGWKRPVKKRRKKNVWQRTSKCNNFVGNTIVTAATSGSRFGYESKLF